MDTLTSKQPLISTNEKGELATSLTILGLVVLILGATLGTWTVENYLYNTSTQASYRPPPDPDLICQGQCVQGNQLAPAQCPQGTKRTNRMCLSTGQTKLGADRICCEVPPPTSTPFPRVPLYVPPPKNAPLVTLPKYPPSPTKSQSTNNQDKKEIIIPTTKKITQPTPSGSQKQETHNIRIDINRDGTINTLDFSLEISQYGKSGQNLNCDVNTDYICNAYDLALIISYLKRDTQ